MVTDPGIKARLEKEMLRLATAPLPTFESTENELYGVSASNPITIDDSDTDDSEVVVSKAPEDDRSDRSEPEEDVSRDSPTDWASQVNTLP